MRLFSRNRCEYCPVAHGVNSAQSILEYEREQQLRQAGFKMSIDANVKQTEQHRAEIERLAEENEEVAELVKSWKASSYDRLLDLMNPEIQEPFPGVVIRDEAHRESLIASLRTLIGVDPGPHVEPGEFERIRDTLEQIDEAEFALQAACAGVGKKCKGPKRLPGSNVLRCGNETNREQYLAALDLASAAVKSSGRVHSDVLDHGHYRQV